MNGPINSCYYIRFHRNRYWPSLRSYMILILSWGCFMSKDIWQGDSMQPMSYNLWLYVYSNPVMYVDPSGELGFLAAALIVAGSTA